MGTNVNKYTWNVPNKEIIESAPYVDEVKRIYQEKKDKNQLYILCGEKGFVAKQTAAAIAYAAANDSFMTLLKAGKKCRTQDERQAMIRNELASLMVEYEKTQNSLELQDTEQRHSGENNAEIIVSKSEITTCDKEEAYRITGDVEAAIEQHIRCDGFLFEGEISDKYVATLIRELTKLQSSAKEPIFLALDGLSDKVINDLIFDNNAEIVNVVKPDVEYYNKILENELAKSGTELASGVNTEEIVQTIRCQRAGQFQESDIKRAVELAGKKAQKQKRKELIMEDFEFGYRKVKDPEDALEQLIGLQNVKDKLKRLTALATFDMKRQGLNYNHNACNVAFAGSPGSGKTMMAEIYAGLLAKCGITDGAFINANKSDYVGKYVGHTAALVRELFKSARNGVIFFEECGCLLTADSYTEEAVTEIVRYMEMYPDVVCIFASYKDNIQKLQEKDAGLKSRISEIIEFEDYTNEELYKILLKFFEEDKLELEESSSVFYKFMDNMRRENADSFGNGRLARNLFERTREILAVETMKQRKNPKEVTCVPRGIFQKAIDCMGKKNEEAHIKTIGFTV